MAVGRTTWNRQRTYIGGYDMSGYTSTLGPLTWEYEEANLDAQTDAIRGYLPGRVTISPGNLNGIFDNSAAGLHAIVNAAGMSHIVLSPIGIRSEPAQGDPCFVGLYQLRDYKAAGDGIVTATIAFDEWDAANLIGYDKPWGVLLHPKQAEEGTNTAIGVDDYGSSSSLGGYMVYQVFSGDGTATIKVQDASTNSNGSFSDLTGATTGSIDCTSRLAGIIPLSRTATVRRYLRWQIALGTATSVTFALAFIRETRS